MNSSILDKIIVGRVEPHIYAFSTNAVPNYLKIGDTYRPVSVRLKEWEQHFPNLVQQFEHIAKTENGKYYRDFAIHYYLETILKLQRLQPSTFPSLPYYSKEFFENATISDIQAAIQDIEKCAASTHSTVYNFYTETKAPIITAFQRTENYPPRPNQKDTIEAFKKAIAEGRNNLLMYAVMRFGKSFTSMCCACEMDAKIVLVVSAKADVQEEWQHTVESHTKFEKYAFIDSSVLERDKNTIGIILKGEENQKKNINDNYARCNRVVIFLTLQDLQGNAIKAKHIDLFNKTIDLLIVDETHFGARAQEYGKVLQLNKTELKNELKDSDETFDDLDAGLEQIKEIQRKITLHLSGTPYRILMGSEFEKEDIIAFYQFSDIINDKEKWDLENLCRDDIKEWENPYYGFPEMVRFAFNLNDSSRKLIYDLRQKGLSASLNNLFKPKSITKDTEGNYKKFVYEKEVLDLLEVIDGSKSETNLLSFLDYDKLKDGKMCRHIVCVLPYRASCDAFEELIRKNHRKFKNLSSYKIINISGVGQKPQKIGDIKYNISQYEEQDQKTISLTVNKMLTGTTVKEWDTMLFLKEVSSPQEYDQAIFRLQNQYVKQIEDPENKDIIKYNMKPQTLLVDFDPVRMFVMQEQKSKIYNVNSDTNGNTELYNRIERELQISPIIVANNGKLEKVTPNNIMDEIRKYSANKSIMDEATSIPVDTTILQNFKVAQILEKISPINSKNGIAMKPNSGDGSCIDLPIENDGNDNYQSNDSSTDERNTLSDSKSQHSDFEDLKKRLATFYAHILFFSMLTNNKVSSLQDIIENIDKSEDDQRIADNIGLRHTDLNILKNSINPFHLSDLDYKIHNINDFINDANVEPIERVEKALTKFGRFSDSEIVTPSKIASDLVKLLPDYNNKRPKILDLASKQGEFTCALYKRYGENVDIYALPTSSIAYEFTRKVYLLLGLNPNNVFKNFNTYDLIRENKEEHINTLKNMEFDAIVGNPPYQVANSGIGNGSAPIYHLFIDLGMTISQKGTLIHPARFLFNAGKTPKDWNRKILNNKHYKVIGYYPNSTDVFPSVDVKGGIASTYWDLEIQHSPIGTFLPHKELQDIVTKVKSHKFSSFAALVYPRDLYRLTDALYSENPWAINRPSVGHKYDVGTNVFEVFPELFVKEKPADTDEYIQIYGRLKNARVFRWVKRKYVCPPDNLDTYKIFIPKSNGSGAIGETLSTPVIGLPVIGHTVTFLSIGKFDTLEEANNALKYIKSKFCRVLLASLKVTQDNPKEVWANIPLQDFSTSEDIDWSENRENIDNQLYKKYGLSDKEIAFIENNVQPMK